MILPSKLQSNKSDQSVSAGSSSLSSAFTRVHYTVFQCNKSQLFNTSFKKLSLCSLPGSPASGAWSVHDLGSWESVIMRRVSMARPSPARLASRESGGFKRQLPSITRHHGAGSPPDNGGVMTWGAHYTLTSSLQARLDIFLTTAWQMTCCIYRVIHINSPKILAPLSKD